MDEHDTSQDNDGWVDNGAEYSPKSEFSKPKVVEEAVSKCMTLRAKEMKKGYFNTTFGKDGLPIKIWIEDSRKAYCSGIQALRVILVPEILQKENDELKKLIEESKQHINKLYKRYAYHTLQAYTSNKKTTYKITEEFYMPEIDAKVRVRKVHRDGYEELVSLVGYWNPQVDAYWDMMVKAHDELFEELIRVAHNLNYFKQAIRWG